MRIVQYRSSDVRCLIRTLIFALPGSNGACKDGWDKLIRWQLDRRHRPCNLAELIPRFTEV